MNFIDLLDDKEQRLLTIFYHCVTQGSITIDELLSNIHVSKPTLFSYIQEINDYHYPKYNSNILFSNSNQIFIKNNLNIDLLFFYKDLAKTSIPATILSQLFLKGTLSISELAEACHCSTVLLYRKIKKLNLFLESYNIQILLSPVRLCGAEEQIRYIYKCFFWSIYRGIEWPFVNLPRQELLDLVQKKTPFLLSYQASVMKESILYDIAIIMTRRKMNYFVSHIITQNMNSPLTKILSSFESLNKSQRLPSISKFENSYILALLEIPSFVSNDPSVTNEMYHFYQHQNHISYEILVFIIQILKQYLTPSDYLKINNPSFKMDVIRTFFILFYFEGDKNNFFPFSKKQHKTNLYLKQLIFHITEKARNKHPLLYKKEAFWTERLSKILATTLSFKKYLPEISILIDTDIDALDNRLIGQIKEFGYNCSFSNFSNPSQLDEYDLLLSNAISAYNMNEVFIFFHQQLTPFDCTLLEKKLHDLTIKKIAHTFTF
ncbi:hypothetical protein HCJ45_06645 [Listeria sp. FSL L7-1517]|uniref:helix-turn-helix domain-containing protein n=1 Tax=Listeria immobilis TaxID=2713502 RepID=UPI00164D1C3A|nr:helix-turn-helix domain-containing protein [Listeria immobilis]MBC6296781.1 hypothetical protein [Listeria immobilis]